MSDTDGDLLGRCRKGDQNAWRELVGTHTRRVFSIAYRFSGRVDEAEDLAQEIFVKVYETLDRFRETEGALGSWLSTVARNHAIDHYRRRRLEQLGRSDNPLAMEQAATPADSPLKSLEREERRQFVHRGLRALPDELRQPLILCDLEGLAYEEIAGLLKIPLGTVKSRINRGRLELAKRLLGRQTDYSGEA